MTRPIILGLACLIVCVVAPADDPAGKFQSTEAPVFNVEVLVRPVEFDAVQLLDRPWPGKYRCSVTVQPDPGSKYVFGPAGVILSPGETKESRQQYDDVAIVFLVELGEEAAFARTSVTITRGEDLLARQVSTVWLKQPARIVPVEPAP